jgi:hypothetical protein
MTSMLMDAVNGALAGVRTAGSKCPSQERPEPRMTTEMPGLSDSLGGCYGVWAGYISPRNHRAYGARGRSLWTAYIAAHFDEAVLPAHWNR